MVLSIPLGQAVEIRLDGIERRHIIRIDNRLDVRLWILSLADVRAHRLEDDAVQRLLRQRTPDGFIGLSWLFRKLYLTVQHIATEQVLVVQKQLDSEHAFQRSVHSLAVHS